MLQFQSEMVLEGWKDGRVEVLPILPFFQSSILFSCTLMGFGVTEWLAVYTDQSLRLDTSPASVPAIPSHAEM